MADSPKALALTAGHYVNDKPAAVSQMRATAIIVAPAEVELCYTAVR